MGFYSIYKIIKDIVKSLFGSKGWKRLLIFIIISIIFLYIFSNFNTSNAAFNFKYVDTRYSFPNLPSDITDYICISDDGNGCYSLYYGTSSFTYDNDGRNLLYSTDLKGYILKEDGDEWNVRTSGISKNKQAYQVGTLIYSNHDIYYTQDSTQLFFSASSRANMPYILNTAEDLATGSFDTIVVEPRRI